VEDNVKMTEIQPGSGRLGRFTKSRSGIVIIVAVVFALVAGTVAILIVSAVPKSELVAETAKPEATPKPTESSSPTPETEKPVDSSEAFRFGITEEDIDQYLNKDDQNAFLARPIEERGNLSLYYAQNLPKFEKDWMSIPGQNTAGNTLPTTISPNNTDDEVNTLVIALHRIPVTLEKSDGTVDQNAAARMVGGNLINGSESPIYQQLIDFNEAHDATTAAPSARSLAASNYLAMGTVNHSSGNFTDASGRICRTLNTTQQGVTGDYTACFITTTSGAGMWFEN
jgi:hypothetical protein